MRPIDEFGLIERYFTRTVDSDDLILGIGDDAAVITGDARMAVAVDTIVSGVHFPIELEAAAVGHRALAVNLSDLAAMGAMPRWATLALTLPVPNEDWVGEFAHGFFALADRFDLALIGGDTTRGPLSVTVQVIGRLGSRAVLTRGGGKPDDLIYVTGTLGDAAAGVAAMAIDERSPASERLIRRFAYPEPRVKTGLALCDVAHAAIDVSDGLTQDLAHICEQSHCGAVVEIDALPLSDALLAVHELARARDFALTGGDDYELCFTAAEADAAAVSSIASATGTAITRIGRLTQSSGLRMLVDGRESPLPVAGYRHF